MDQLCVRTEFSFRRAFGQIPKVIAAAIEVGAKSIAITDNTTFGHVAAYKAAKEAGIKAIFGAEVFCRPDAESDDKRTIMIYAATEDSLSELYNWMTLSEQQHKALMYDDVAQMSGAIIKVAYTCLDARLIPQVDYIAVNPSSPHLRAAAMQLAKEHGKKILPMSDCFYLLQKYREPAGLVGVSMKPTPQWMLTREQANYYMPDVPADAYQNIDEFVARIGDVHPVKATNIKHKMDLYKACQVGIKKKFTKKTWTKEHEARLDRELKTIHDKGFDDYFAVLHGMCKYARERMLVGPARGSAAGSLACYLLDITEIDPLKYDLLFERFIDETRYDFPDIDMDFPDDKRELIFQYLRNTYGEKNVAHIGTVSRLKAKSAIGEVAKRYNIPPWETSAVKGAMIERSGGDSRAASCIEDTFTMLEIGQAFIRKYPEMRGAAELENHASHSGIHAAGAIVCNDPVSNYCTINDNGVAQIDKKDAETINLMKIDVLGLRTLSVINATGINIHGISLEDKKAFKVFNEGKMAGIFQFEGQACKAICQQVGVHQFEDIVSITSLARPGPLYSGGATAFISRRNKTEEIVKVHDIFDRITEQTYGMVLYQEQVMQILRQVGNMEWADVQILRRAMSKSLGTEFFEKFYVRFQEGARENKIKDVDTRKMWDLMIHFGSYGFNKSHAVAYALITYWCAWLKAHHPVEFAVASLSHAKDEEQAKHILREIVNEGEIEYVPFDAKHSEISWSFHDGKLLGGLMGIKGVGLKTAKDIVKARAAGKLSPRQQALLDAPELMYTDLFPARTKFGDIYQNPGKHNIRGTISYIGDIDNTSEGSFVVIARLNKKDIRDLNDPMNLQKRGGKIAKDHTLLLNMDIEDDTDKIVATITRYDYVKPMGKLVRDAPAGSWWLFRGNILKGYRKLYIRKAKRLE